MTILWIMGFKEYKKIKDVARQQIETTLKDKRALLLVTLVAIIEAFKLNPEKQILISNVPSNSDNQPFYLHQTRNQFLELAEQHYNQLVNEFVTATMKSAYIQ